MSKTKEVFAQSSGPEAHVKNARQTKNTKQNRRNNWNVKAHLNFL